MLYREGWEMLFDIAKLGDLDKPLTPKILSKPTHPVTIYILYLYSMESFIYSELNKACREKDTSKIKYYGAYAAALSYIIYFANSNRKNHKMQGTTVLYRGLQMHPCEVEKFARGFITYLVGYTSTSQNLATAVKFARMSSKNLS